MNKYFKLCDLVGRAPPLLINNKKTLKTTIGAIFTIMIVITTIVTTCFFGQELFVRKNPSVNFSTAEIHHPPFLQYDEQNFEIAFGLEDSESNLFIDETVYYPIATMRKTILVNGEMEYEDTNITAFGLPYWRTRVWHCFAWRTFILYPSEKCFDTKRKESSPSLYLERR